MINMVRIQGPAMGYPGLQKPILPTMGQNGAPNGTGVIGPGAADPHADVTPDFFVPPAFNFPVLTDTPAVVAPYSAAPAVPTWLWVTGGLAAGVAIALLMKKS